MNVLDLLNEYKAYIKIISRRVGRDKDVEKAEIIIAALEKQIPKRPDFEGDGYDENGYLIYDTWICPCCEEAYEVDYDNYKHCPNCGQAIDWSDTE